MGARLRPTNARAFGWMRTALTQSQRSVDVTTVKHSFGPELFVSLLPDAQEQMHTVG